MAHGIMSVIFGWKKACLLVSIVMSQVFSMFGLGHESSV